jgi:hypothetical protein
MGLTNPSFSKRRRPAGPEKSPDLNKSTYLISIALKDDAEALASVQGKHLVLNERGRRLLDCWWELGITRPGILPHSAMVTERHFQGIIMLSAGGGGGGGRGGGGGGDASLSMNETVRLFKVLSSQRLSQPGKRLKATLAPLWKKGYSEHKIIGARELAKVRKIFPGLIEKA